jgi:arsenate reductase
MAEGLLNAWAPDRFEAISAGTEATRVRPEAIEVMAELGIDISAQRSKSIAEIQGDVDTFITVCDNARESCPVMPGVADVVHWSIHDPSLVRGAEAERVAAFRAARDDIAGRIRTLIDAMADGASMPRGM